MQGNTKTIQQERRSLIKTIKNARELGFESKVIDRLLIVGEEEFSCGTIPEQNVSLFLLLGTML